MLNYGSRSTFWWSLSLEIQITRNYQKMQRVNGCLYLIYMGFSEYYCGPIRIFTVDKSRFKSQELLIILKKDSSESYWVKNWYKFNLWQKDFGKKKENWIKRTNLEIFYFRKNLKDKNLKFTSNNNLCLQQFSQSNSFFTFVCSWFTLCKLL